MKLHIGCGKRHIPGWVHIDLIPHEHVDIIANADSLPFDDCSADVIYASHILEHFERHRVNNVLSEWRRVLKPGGVLRVCVPDFMETVKNYIKYKDLNVVLGQLVGGQKHSDDYHKNVFDEKTMKQHLQSAGFKTSYRYDWRETEHANLDDFSQSYWPHMDKENGQNLSLNMEAIK